MSSPAATYRVDDRRSADRVTDAVMDSLGLRPGGFREALRTAILETAYNVADWAGSGEIAVERSPDGVGVVVLDQGPGIPATMRSAFPELNDEELLLRAVEPGVSSTGEQFRGFGLWASVQVSMYGAGVTLETGGVAALFRQGRAVSCSKSSSRTLGVTVRFLLPADASFSESPRR